MVRFTVDTASLDDLSSSISGVYSQMQAMHGVAFGFEGLLGGSDLEGSVQGFSSNWSNGITHLSSDMAEVVQALNEASANYSTTEQEIADSAE